RVCLAVVLGRSVREEPVGLRLEETAGYLPDDAAVQVIDHQPPLVRRIVEMAAVELRGGVAEAIDGQAVEPVALRRAVLQLEGDAARDRRAGGHDPFAALGVRGMQLDGKTAGRSA